MFKDVGDFSVIMGAGSAQEITDAVSLLSEVPFEIFTTLEAENPKHSIFKDSLIVGVLKGPKEELWMLQGAHSFKIDSKWSFGSGGDLALAAMDLGKTASQAVKFAAKRDLHTNTKVQSYKLKGLNK